MVKPNTWLHNYLGLCFCGHCVANATAAGIDAKHLKKKTREDIETYLAGGIDFPDDMAEAFWLSDVATDGALSTFLTWRCDVVTSLVREIRSAVRTDATVAIIPSVARPTGGAWYEGSNLTSSGRSHGNHRGLLLRAECGARARRRSRCPTTAAGGGKAAGILRPGFPDLQSGRELIAAAHALRDAGVSEIAFYNYGHLRRSNLAWIADALAVFGG